MGSLLLETGAQYPWVALRADGTDVELTTELSLPWVRKLGYLSATLISHRLMVILCLYIPVTFTLPTNGLSSYLRPEKVSRQRDTNA